MILRKFYRNEDGGADQLIIAAILIVIGIGIALMFGDQIKSMVQSIIDKPDLPKVSDYSGTGNNDEKTPSQPSTSVLFIKGNYYSCTKTNSTYNFVDDNNNTIVLKYDSISADSKIEIFIDNNGKRYRFISYNTQGYTFDGFE